MAALHFSLLTFSGEKKHTRNSFKSPLCIDCGLFWVRKLDCMRTGSAVTLNFFQPKYPLFFSFTIPSNFPSPSSSLLSASSSSPLFSFNTPHLIIESKTSNNPASNGICISFFFHLLLLNAVVFGFSLSFLCLLPFSLCRTFLFSGAFQCSFFDQILIFSFLNRLHFRLFSDAFFFSWSFLPLNLAFSDRKLFSKKPFFAHKKRLIYQEIRIQSSTFPNKKRSRSKVIWGFLFVCFHILYTLRFFRRDKCIVSRYAANYRFVL